MVLNFICFLLIVYFFVTIGVNVISIIYFRFSYIKGNGFNLLKKELSSCRLSEIDGCILYLDGNSDIKGKYINSVPKYVPMLYPYYLTDNNDFDYGILIFTKEYYLVKSKFIELRKKPYEFV